MCVSSSTLFFLDWCEILFSRLVRDELTAQLGIIETRGCIESYRDRRFRVVLGPRSAAPSMEEGYAPGRQQFVLLHGLPKRIDVALTVLGPVHLHDLAIGAPHTILRISSNVLNLHFMAMGRV